MHFQNTVNKSNPNNNIKQEFCEKDNVKLVVSCNNTTCSNSDKQPVKLYGMLWELALFCMCIRRNTSKCTLG